MILAPLMFLQIFTETILPKTPGQCIAVVKGKTVFLAQSATRTRLTGRLVLKMRGAPLPLLESEASTCANECFAKIALVNPCVARCSTQQTASERVSCAKQCVPASPPPSPTPGTTERDRAAQARKSLLGPDPDADRRSADFYSSGLNLMWVCEQGCSARVTRFAGRDLELLAPDAISNPSRCTCDRRASCVDK